MTKELLEEYLEKVSENTDFTFQITEFNDSKVEMGMYGDNPCGEDWFEYLDIENPETEKELIGLLYAEVLDCYESFDVEENVYNMLAATKRNGFSGVPGVVDLVHNEEYKENALKEYKDKLLEMFRSYGKDYTTKSDEKLYRVRYYECYERYYDVSAHSEDEAEEKLKEDIANGRENPPEECYDSGAEVVGNGDDN
jgi:hypothetical protein